jgi:hypothetical protein
MRYTELLDRFWGMDREFSNYERVLYLYLLHRCNSLGWPDTFSISNEELVGILKCRPTIMKEARKALIDAGLITFDVGNGRGKSSFFSIVAERGNNRNPFNEKVFPSEPLFEQERGNNRNPFINASGSKSSDVNSESDEKVFPSEPLFEQEKEKQNKKEKNPPAPPIKKKINKKKTPHTINVCVHTREDGQEEIVFKDLERELSNNKKKTPLEPNLPKGLEDVLLFFEKNAADKLPDWRDEAEAFFYHYESYGWNGTSNRKIVDWESKANLWICDKAMKKKSNQTPQSNGPTANNNTRSPRGASDEEVAELMERLLREGELEREGLSRQVQP